MPLMDGLESTRKIRQVERSENIRPATIIALTGLGSATIRREAIASGMDLFLTKPVNLKSLQQTLGGYSEDSTQSD
jgi:CheY-like chemotaxis protein